MTQEHLSHEPTNTHNNSTGEKTTPASSPQNTASFLLLPTEKSVEKQSTTQNGQSESQNLNYSPKSIFRTKEAQKVYTKTLKLIESYFTHPQTKEILHKFIAHKADYREILEIAKQVESVQFLKRETQVKNPIPYSVYIVTENEEVYRELKKTHHLVELLTTNSQLDFLNDYDIIQAIDCDRFTYTLEQHDHVIFYEEDFYPEQYVKKLVNYEKSISQLEEADFPFAKDAIAKVKQLSNLIAEFKSIATTPLSADAILQSLNEKLEETLEKTSISASQLLFIHDGRLPKQVKQIVEDIIAESGIPASCFQITVPIQIDKDSFKQYEKQHMTEQLLPLAKKMQDNAQAFAQVQTYLHTIHQHTLLNDFAKGLRDYIADHDATPIDSASSLHVTDAKNPHIKKAQAISYELSQNYPGALLTGANSGGKTTLLEHIVTLIALKQIGLPANGKNALPEYDGVYYFAKSKGSTNKGAFETMLMQLSQIDASGNVLILADEMEAVTEPSVAAKVMGSTIKYFVAQNAHCIFATHLGEILKSYVGKTIRIDGIHAKGFDEKGNIMIDHNPKPHTLAASTPELIIQKLAKQTNADFLEQLAKKL